MPYQIPKSYLPHLEHMDHLYLGCIQVILPEATKELLRHTPYCAVRPPYVGRCAGMYLTLPRHVRADNTLQWDTRRAGSSALIFSTPENAIITLRSLVALVVKLLRDMERDGHHAIPDP